MFTMRVEPAAAAVLSIGGSRMLVSSKWPTWLVANMVSMPYGERVYSGTIGRARQRVRHYVSANTANTAHSGLPALSMRIFRRSSLVNRWSATRLTSAMSLKSHRTKSVRVSRSSLLRPPFSAHRVFASVYLDFVLTRMYTAAAGAGR